MEGRGPELLGGSEVTSTLGKKFSFCKYPGPCPERACLAMGVHVHARACACVRACASCVGVHVCACEGVPASPLSDGPHTPGGALSRPHRCRVWASQGSLICPRPLIDSQSIS